MGDPEDERRLREMGRDARARKAEKHRARRKEYERVRRMLRRGAPIHPPEWVTDVRRAIWPNGEPDTVTVRGHELLPVDRHAARGTGARVHLSNKIEGAG